MHNFINLLLITFLYLIPLNGKDYTFRELLNDCETEQIVALHELRTSLNLTDTTQFHPLEGGLSKAKLYSFQIGENQYVLRFLVLQPSYTKEMRQNEIDALIIGNSLRIAPHCVFFDQNAVLIVMPFLEGHALNKPEDSQLLQLGKMIRTLHDYSHSYPTRYSINDRITLHHQKGIKAGIAYPTGFDIEVKKTLSKTCLRPLVPTHGDLNPTNIIVNDSRNSIDIIDWTTATIQDPFPDLGYFCLLANLSKLQEILFLEAYFGRNPTQEEYEILYEEKSKVNLLTAVLWFRFSETTQERTLPIVARVAALDAALYSPTLKPAQDYLNEQIVVDLNTDEKSAIKSYALSFYKAYLDSKTGGESCYNPKLCDKLTMMYEKDQNARLDVINSGYPSSDEGIKIVEKIDQEHLTQLKIIIEEFGWPDFRIAGPEGADKIWLLVQHCDNDLEFQKKCLELLKIVVLNGTASKHHLAYLTDRILINEKKPQVYGTQIQIVDGQPIILPVENPENLNNRRASMGLTSCAEYLDFIRDIVHLKN